MYVRHAPDLRADFPELVAGVLVAEGIAKDAVVVDERVAAFEAVARSRLGAGSESELPEIRAWRRAFSRMGLEPTRYRCASEALLRRLRKEGSLPRIHPLIDLCNAVSLAFAIPVAVFDVSKLADGVEVRRATGDETFETFSGEKESPVPGEVIFADAAGRAQARRWTNRQSGSSAVRAGTEAVLVVAEAMHESASEDVPRLLVTLATELKEIWSVSARTATLSASEPRFDF